MRPIVALHGYGSGPRAFDVWRTRLAALGHEESYASHYWTQSDDVGLHDLAEGFDRALDDHPALRRGRPFDAIVHSTGMLVLRAWLSARPERRDRLGSIVALAPATFGSPLAHLGRGMLGALFAGDRTLGPDFLEAGDRVLAALELGSAEAWELADHDLPDTLIACGIDGYPFPLSLSHPDGSDGVVRFAGCDPYAPLTTLDLRRGVDDGERARRPVPAPARRSVVAVPDRNHATILADPPSWLVERAAALFETRDPTARPDTARPATARPATGGPATLQPAEVPPATVPPATVPPLQETGAWRQWLVRVVDERGDPVPDYFLDLLVRLPGTHRWRPLRAAHPEVRVDVHVHRDDRSRRCFHLELGHRSLLEASWGVRVMAKSGSDRVGYAGRHASLDVEEALRPAPWTASSDLGRRWRSATTERLLIRLDREPLPFEGRNRLVRVAATPSS